MPTRPVASGSRRWTWRPTATSWWRGPDRERPAAATTSSRGASTRAALRWARKSWSTRGPRAPSVFPPSRRRHRRPLRRRLERRGMGGRQWDLRPRDQLAGNAVGAVFRVNDYKTGVQSEPAVATDADGNITVVWSGDCPFDYDGICGRRMDYRGLRRGPVHGEHAPPACRHPAVARCRTATSRWCGAGHGAARRRSSGGASPPTGRRSPVHFDINSYRVNDQAAPAIASDSAGNLFITWNSFGQDGSRTASMPSGISCR